jgi:hypothetical protein
MGRRDFSINVVVGLRDGSINVVVGLMDVSVNVPLGLSDLEVEGIDFRQGQESFVVSTESRPALGSAKPPSQCLSRPPPRGKATGRVKLASHNHLGPKLR